MASLTAAIIRDTRSATKRGYVTAQFTETVSGKTYKRTAQAQPEDDVLAKAQALIPRLEVDFRDAELDLAWYMWSQGRNPHTETYVWVSSSEINQHCVRRTANLDPSNEDEAIQLGHSEAVMMTVGFTNRQLNGLLEGANEAQIAAWRAKAAAFNAARDALAKDLPEQDPRR